MVLLFLIYFISQVFLNDCAEVDVRLVQYQNYTATCKDNPPCNFKFSLTYIGTSSRKTFKFVRSKSFPTDDNYSIFFVEGDDGLGRNLMNPQRLRLGNGTVENVRVRVKVFDTDYSTEANKYISKFVLDLDVTTALNQQEHNASFTDGPGQLDYTFKDKCAEGVAVDVTIKKYHNATTVCSAGIPSIGCDFMFSFEFEGISSQTAYKKLTTESYTADGNNDVIFLEGNDALGSGNYNPITINLNTMEDIKLKVKIVDEDLLFDDYITNFAMVLDVRNKESFKQHTVQHTSPQGSGLFRLTYEVFCDGNQDGIGCGGCKKDFYGTNCTKSCKPTGNFTCDTNGDLVCKPDYYNTSCDVYCSPSSQYNCSNDGSRLCLGRWTGPLCDTLQPCPTGLYGAYCTVNCTEDPGRYTCNNTSGERICEVNWAGPQCDTCSQHYYGTSCNKLCQATSAWNCSSSGDKVCLGHFTGQDCNVCQAGWFGSGCDQFCDGNSTYWTCDDQGNKICNGNREGPNCSDCSPDWYGNNCTVNCVTVSNQYTCNTTNGEKICEVNWKGTDCDSCSQDHYGLNCDRFCQPGSGWNCSDSGDRICLGHFTGDNCTVCDGGWYGSGCDVYCDPNSGQWTCDDQGRKICNKNKAGDDCEECAEGWFGDDCLVECRDNERYTCTNNGNKTCIGNREGAECDRCKDGYSGVNCTCKRDEGRVECDKEGNLHCLGHWTGPLCAMCEAGFTGEKCEQPHRPSPVHSLPNLSNSLLIFCVISGVIFSMATAAVLIGVVKSAKLKRRSSLRIKPGMETQVVAFKNHHFEESQPASETTVQIEFIEDM